LGAAHRRRYLRPVFYRGLSPAEVRRRLPRLIGAFAILGFAVTLTVRADLGLSPWDVLHQGISRHTGIPIGTVGILVGLVVLLAWIPLGERIGLGTLLNVVLIGVCIDLTLLVVPETTATPLRWAELAVGTFLFGPGVAMYLSCGLGAGPRDGVMTALVARGLPLRVIRTAMEVAVLAAGFAMGGTVGIGTVLLALTIGPNIHHFLERFRLDPAPSA
jgi:uncharacterized membrane protein YczE